MTENFPPEVAAVRQRFEDWRAAQTRKGPLPKELWQAAAALGRQFPLTLVARACRLNASQLRQVARAQPQPSPQPQGAVAFRTLTTETLSQAAALLTPPVAEVRFALERPDGTRLVITCSPQSTELAVALCRQLLDDCAVNGKTR
jgi:hypothetical protein